MTAGLLATAQSGSPIPDPSLGGMLVKMLLIVGVLALIAVFLRRRSGGGGMGNRQGLLSRLLTKPGGASAQVARPGLRIVSKQQLTKGACLAIAEFDGRRVLVGVTSAGVTFYREGDEKQPDADETAGLRAAAPDPIDAELLSLVASGEQPESRSFIDSIRSLTDRH